MKNPSNTTNSPQRRGWASKALASLIAVALLVGGIFLFKSNNELLAAAYEECETSKVEGGSQFVLGPDRDIVVVVIAGSADYSEFNESVVKCLLEKMHASDKLIARIKMVGEKPDEGAARIAGRYTVAWSYMDNANRLKMSISRLDA